MDKVYKNFSSQSEKGMGTGKVTPSPKQNVGKSAKREAEGMKAAPRDGIRRE